MKKEIFNLGVNKEANDIEWTAINKVKMMTLVTASEIETIEEVMKQPDVAFKTMKYYKRDLHNKKVELRNLNKQLRKLNLQEKSNQRKSR